MLTTVGSTPSHSVSWVSSPKTVKFYFKRNEFSFKIKLDSSSEVAVNLRLAGVFDRIFRKTQVITLGGHSRRFTERSLIRELPSQTGANLAQKVFFLQNCVSPLMDNNSSLIKGGAKQPEPVVVVEDPESLSDNDTTSISSFDFAQPYKSATTLEEYMEEVPAVEVERSSPVSNRAVESSVLQSTAQRRPARSSKSRRLHSKLKTLFASNLKRYDKDEALTMIKWKKLPSAEQLEDINNLKEFAKGYNKLVTQYEINRIAKKFTCDVKDVIAGLLEHKKEIEKQKKALKQKVMKRVGKEVSSTVWKHLGLIHSVYKKAPRFEKAKLEAAKGASGVLKTISDAATPASAVVTWAATLAVANQDFIFEGAQKYLSTRKIIKSAWAEVKELNKASGKIAKAAKRALIVENQKLILEIFS